MDSLVERDSPLSTTSSVAGILTFIVAIVAAVYVRMNNLRNSRDDFFRVKASLSWYKTESAWLAELLAATGPATLREKDDEGGGPRNGGEAPRTTEYHMYAFVMEDLERLEARLLELVAETEVKAANAEPGAAAGLAFDGRADAWTLVPRGWTWSWNRTTVAMAWLPVRSKALELVRQRDALTGRVQFAQMSMVAGCVLRPPRPAGAGRANCAPDRCAPSKAGRPVRRRGQTKRWDGLTPWSRRSRPSSRSCGARFGAPNTSGPAPTRRAGPPRPPPSRRPGEARRADQTQPEGAPRRTAVGNRPSACPKSAGRCRGEDEGAVRIPTTTLSYRTPYPPCHMYPPAHARLSTASGSSSSMTDQIHRQPSGGARRMTAR